MAEDNIRAYITGEILGKFNSGSAMDKHTLLGCSIILQTVIKTLMNILSVSNFFKAHSNTLGDIGELIIQDSVLGMKDTNLEIRVVSAQNLKSFVEALCCLVNKLLDNKASQALVTIFSKEKGILEKLSHVLLSPVLQQPSLIFFPQPQNKTEECVNNAKAEILELLKSMINHLFIKCPPQTKLNTLVYFKTLTNVIATVVEQTQAVYSLSKSQISQLPESAHRIMLACLGLMSKSTKLQDFYSIYSPAAKSLVYVVVFPELVVSEKEIEDFDHNEVEFVSFSMDVCFSQKSKVAKTFAMEILENLCDKIDGILTFTAVGVLALSDTILAQRSESDLVKEFPALEPIIHSEFVKQNRSEKVLDVCILVITSLSFLIVARQDLMYLLIDLGMD